MFDAAKIGKKNNLQQKKRFLLENFCRKSIFFIPKNYTY